MSFWDKFKDIVNIPDEDDFDDLEETPAEERKSRDAEAKSEPAPRVVAGRSKTVQYNPPKSAVQVVLVKPDRFEDVKGIANHLNEKKTVVLNLENVNREVARRIIDFISGATYANHGDIRKVANGTFIIVPSNVDVTGELLPDDYGTDNKLYF